MAMQDIKEIMKKRSKYLIAFVLIIVLCFVYYLTSQTGLVPGANEKVDERIKAYKDAEEAKETMEGQILDVDGNPITVAEEKGVPAKCLYPECYSSIVGYRSKIYGTSGLRERYKDILLHGGKDKKGANLVLTINNQFQQYCYDLLEENVGSITVYENYAGNIRAMVSRGDSNIEYNVNEIDKNFQTYQNIDGFFYNRAVLAQDAPGSTFKMITAAALLENGKENYIYKDAGEYLGIHNAGRAAYGTLNLTNAMIHSSNTYFASAGNLLGGAKLYETGKKFYLGEEIPLDFTTLKSNFDLEYYQEKLVAQTAFGQGKTQISPLQIGMILQSIVGYGSMTEPYMVAAIEDDGKIDQFIDPKRISGDTMSEASAGKLREVLHQTALSYGLGEEYGTIYAKTGTVQFENKNYHHTYLVFASEDYTGVISMDQSKGTSHDLVKIAKAILEYLKK